MISKKSLYVIMVLFSSIIIAVGIVIYNLEHKLIQSQTRINSAEMSNLQNVNNNLSQKDDNQVIEESMNNKLLTFDGAPRTLPDNMVSLKYKNQNFVPLQLFTSIMGISVSNDGNFIQIGNNAIINEGFRPNTDTTINEKSSLSDLSKILGKPIFQKSYMNEVIGQKEELVKFNGVEITTTRDITINKPVLETYRGITIGSTMNDVQNNWKLILYRVEHDCPIRWSD
jgi:hypothetical protein